MTQTKSTSVSASNSSTVTSARSSLSASARTSPSSHASRHPSVPTRSYLKSSSSNARPSTLGQRNSCLWLRSRAATRRISIWQTRLWAARLVQVARDLLSCTSQPKASRMSSLMKTRKTSGSPKSFPKSSPLTFREESSWRKATRKKTEHDRAYSGAKVEICLLFG